MLSRLFMTGLLIFSAPIFADESVGSFKITSIAVFNPGNMSFRIMGMPAMTSCPAGPGWAYVDDNDPGSKTKISTLLAAYTAGKNVTLQVAGVNYFNNGDKYCGVTAIGVAN